MSATPTSQELEKQAAATAALRWVRDGMLVGLGTGSTAAPFIRALGEAVRTSRLRVQATATSEASAALAREVGISLIPPQRGLRFDLTVDGADELDSQLRLIKGGGGALLREKVLATASDYLLIVADSSKVVTQLGKFPLPLEVVPFALPWVVDAVTELGANPVVRVSKTDAKQHILSDQGNLLVDCHFGQISEPAQLATQLKTIPGLVEHGLFLGLASAALVAHGKQVEVLQAGKESVSATDFTAFPS